MRPVLLVLALLLLPAPALAADGTERFPDGFLWGTAIAGFQTEMGPHGQDADRRSDWWAWTHSGDPRLSKDRPERGPGHWRRYRDDVRLAARGLGANAYRFGVEWSRIFPRTTATVANGRLDRAALRALDRLADRKAVAHYRAELRAVRAAGMEPFLTINHFTLPVWLHDPVAVGRALAGRGGDDPLPELQRAGWLAEGTVNEFRKYAAYLAWKLGDLVTYWTPINEPMVVATYGYANIPGVFAGYFPPGAFTFRGAVRAVTNMEAANTAAYDAVHRLDRRAKVGLVQNMIAFTPADPASAADVAATDHADHLFNRLFLDAAVKGDVDLDANGAYTGAERDRHARKADFVGVNYYFRGRVSALGGPISQAIPVLDFVPRTGYRGLTDPGGAPCPTTCTEFGAELYPEGLRQVLRTAGRYRLPVYVTETGLADGDDDQRPRFLVDHLREVRKAIADGVRVRGVFHWSLTDNFEWAAGYTPKFGLYTIRRRARPSAKVFARIVRENRVAPALVRRYAP
ncbi:MAG: glycoside hydrolase family 1 protein [Solirubrobacterales bacterium]|nr:glycoside hydrolase family 1 protein [Solirubrobacterales bacterium]